MGRSPSRDESAGRRLLSTRAAAQVAACSDDTIRRHIRQGRLHALRLGAHGDYRVPVAALEAWLDPAGPDEETR